MFRCSLDMYYMLVKLVWPIWGLQRHLIIKLYELCLWTDLGALIINPF
jgi:hypothetical protein